MEPSSSLIKLQHVITKMPLGICCDVVLPELGVRWKEVSHAIKKFNLPMVSSSVARVLCRHAAKSMPPDEMEEILGRLQLKLAVTQSRTWHVIRLIDPVEEPGSIQFHKYPHRIGAALRRAKNRGVAPEIHSLTMNDLVYISIRMSGNKSACVHVAYPPTHAAVLVSSPRNSVLMQAIAEGLGYASFEKSDLHGRHIPSLLRMSDPMGGGRADHLAVTPSYHPAPVVTATGIDYTNKQYNDMYVDNLIGPNPPLLTDLNIKTSKCFFERTKVNKKINVTISLKTDDVAKSLRTWAVKQAILPTSELFQIFSKIKSNNIQYEANSESD